MTDVLRVAAPTGISETILVRAVKDLLRVHPDLRVMVKDGTTPEVKDYLRDQLVDLALAGKDIAKGDSAIETRMIPHDDENVLAVAVGDLPALKERLTKEDLADILNRRILIGREGGSGVHEKALEYLEGQNLNVKVNDEQFIVESLEGSVRAVAAGIGVAILPRGTVQEICPQHIKGLRLPAGIGDRRQFYVAWRSGHKFSEVQVELCRVLGLSELPSF